MTYKFNIHFTCHREAESQRKQLSKKSWLCFLKTKPQHNHKKKSSPSRKTFLILIYSSIELLRRDQIQSQSGPKNVASTKTGTFRKKT